MKNNLQILFPETVKDLPVQAQIVCFLRGVSSFKPGPIPTLPFTEKSLLESKFTSILRASADHTFCYLT